MAENEQIVFVTVGSTRFDKLVAAVLSEQVIERLKRHHFTKLVIQTGNSEVKLPQGDLIDQEGFSGLLHGLLVDVWPFKPSLNDEYAQAGLVIGHAGSGTIIEVLRAGRKMIAVPNETLLHNHQAELAEALDQSNHLVSSTALDLPNAIDRAMTRTFKKFPEYDGSKFSKILDREMGFV
ncbi:glycosyl transferase [Serendipita vermifera]|nr:glycosyl transferase [Serendipita vermifera]